MTIYTVSLMIKHIMNYKLKSCEGIFLLGSFSAKKGIIMVLKSVLKSFIFIHLVKDGFHLTQDKHMSVMLLPF